MRLRAPYRRLRIPTWIAIALLCAPVACRRGVAPPPPEPGGARILFVGNSLTYENDLPRTVADLAAGSGVTLNVETIAFPNFSLEDHRNDGRALRAIEGGRWTCVVLQQGPSALESSRQLLIAMTRYFHPHIQGAGGRTALYMVWPAQANLADFPRVADSYRLAAEAASGLFLPAGVAWTNAWGKASSLPLYAPDGLHPTALGTYLAAAVMYERFTGRDARELPAVLRVGGNDHPEVPESTVRLLQAAAHEANEAYP